MESMSRHRSVVWAGRSRHSAQTVRKTCSTVLLLLLVMVCIPVRAERIKDIVEIHGVRGNPLTGVGLVIGLAGTGDTGLLSRQMLTNILRESGLVLSPSELTGGNIAVVLLFPNNDLDQE